MGSTLFSILICESISSSHFKYIHMIISLIAKTVTRRTEWRWPASARLLASSALATSPISLTGFGTSAVKRPCGNSKYIFVSFFCCRLPPLTDIARLKGAARRPHRGPTGKKKPIAPKKKSAQRREMLFESTEKATTSRAIPLIAIQHQTESKRAETLAWVSTLFLFARCLVL